MRSAPYPASEDPFLTATFGEEALCGLTVLCTGGGKKGDDQWIVVVGADADGIRALECFRRTDGRTTVVSKVLRSQEDWIDVFDRAMDPALEFDDDLIVGDWMKAEIAVSELDPNWDPVASEVAWDRAVEMTERARDEIRAECERIENLSQAEIVERAIRVLDAGPADARGREIARAMERFPSAKKPGSRPN